MHRIKCKVEVNTDVHAEVLSRIGFMQMVWFFVVTYISLLKKMCYEIQIKNSCIIKTILLDLEFSF